VGRVDTAKTSRFAMLSAEHVFRMDAGAGIRDEGWLSGGSSLVGAGIMVRKVVVQANRCSGRVRVGSRGRSSNISDGLIAEDTHHVTMPTLHRE
jgi:hypothetical protein